MQISEPFNYSIEQLHQYHRNILKFEILEVLRIIWKSRSEGLLISEIEDYSNIKRRTYEKAFWMLEFAGLIENRPAGRSNRYFMTEDGTNLVRLLAQNATERDEDK